MRANIRLCRIVLVGNEFTEGHYSLCPDYVYTAKNAPDCIRQLEEGLDNLVELFNSEMEEGGYAVFLSVKDEAVTLDMADIYRFDGETILSLDKKWRSVFGKNANSPFELRFFKEAKFDERLPLS